MKGTLRDSEGRALAGQPVRVYVTGGGLTSWRYWFTTTTDATGVFSKVAGMSRTRTIKAVYLPPSATYARADSRSVTVGVATKVTVTSPAHGSRVAAGRAFVVRGRTYPAQPGASAALYRRLSDGRLQWLRTARIASDGTFALSKALPRGWYALQVATSATTTNLRGTSSFFTIRVA
ncbi:MAG TPA: hypothetical protein VNA20_19000 [Frankiaceae bacterium]|nr:hypothetical protein [Frankiaceae bacterium]